MVNLLLSPSKSYRLFSIAFRLAMAYCNEIVKNLPSALTKKLTLNSNNYGISRAYD